MDVPELGQLSAQAIAPVFTLVAVVNLTLGLLGRLGAIVEKARQLSEIPDEAVNRGHLKADIPRLKARAKLLTSAARMALASGICTSLLLIFELVSGFLGLQYEYGAVILFVLAVGLLGAALFKFGQEVKISLSEADQYR